MSCANLQTQLVGLTLANPVIAASGTFGSQGEYHELINLRRLGAMVTKGTTLDPRPGNSGQRIVDTPSGIINCIGLENPGVDYLVQFQAPLLAAYQVPIIANIAGSSPEETAQAAGRAAASPHIAAIELNISCPNVQQGGAVFGASPETAREITRQVRAQVTKPLLVKLAPMVTDICQIAVAVAEGGADALSLINTLPALAIDIHRRCPVLGNISGGLSGPAIKPVALKAVWDVYRCCGLPIVGLGGISKWQDAVEFFLAGACAIQVGTATFGHPPTMEEIIDGLTAWMEENGVKNLKEVVGSANQR